ncbi:hypothetical protein BDK51DRAFT_51895 [Blyttiomyces helicus]|uniref:Uncharacterized protein n=1 Tax=Blyttiomyces helicus TaxID=388810 RepID=A0A4P9VXV6_9FUNG|nr:hypothetical protein BDK51DRAFT_51895 [Blyttiomyces helicus]|eukprot:RKO84591.1 hypothetical protein BDK51DRAFT_51895 [Blyttiomyces helicus]
MQCNPLKSTLFLRDSKAKRLVSVYAGWYQRAVGGEVVEGKVPGRSRRWVKKGQRSDKGNPRNPLRILHLRSLQQTHRLLLKIITSIPLPVLLLAAIRPSNITDLSSTSSPYFAAPAGPPAAHTRPAHADCSRDGEDPRLALHLRVPAAESPHDERRRPGRWSLQPLRHTAQAQPRRPAPPVTSSVARRRSGLGPRRPQACAGPAPRVGTG